MRIAVAYEQENGQVFQHFGRTEQFKVYDVEAGQVLNSVVMPTGAGGHGALADLLSQMKADVLICGGIGGNARAALAEAGIMVYPGVIGMADQAVAAMIAGSLNCNPDTVCGHHEGGHACGGHCAHHHGEGHECRHGSCNG